MKYISGCALLIALCINMSALATEVEDAPSRDTESSYYNISYKINADGSYTEEHGWATKILKQRALEYNKSVTISYSTSIQQAEVLEAYTLKMDGRRVEVPKSNYQVQINGGNGDGAPVFSDITQMTVVFPELAVGDTTVFHYRLVGSAPLFPGHFSKVVTFSPQTYYDEVNISFDAPAELPVHHQSWFLESVRDEVADGRRITQWHWSNTQPLKPDPAPPLFEFERNPGLVYSTFASYEDIVQAYGTRAIPKAAVTERIQKLANEIAGAQIEPRAVAQTLYEWVATNITYAGNCIGLGMVVPHDTDFVLDNRMGDCKDQATLLQALLAAKNIQSTQALINSGNLYHLPSVPAAQMVNHVINYIPAWDMFLDPTASNIPFGMLPWGDAGKPVFLVDGYHADTRTPAANKNRQTMHMHMTVAADGSIKGEEQIEQAGYFAVNTRASLRNSNPEFLKQDADAFFKRWGANGSGKFDYSDAAALSDHYRYSVNYKVDQMLPIPGGLTVQAFASGKAISNFAASANDPVPDQGELTCSSVYLEEDYVIDFAPSIKILALPPNVEIKTATVSYKAQYTRNGNQVRILRVFDDRTPGSTCTSAFMREYNALMQKIQPNLRAQVVYQ